MTGRAPARETAATGSPSLRRSLGVVRVSLTGIGVILGAGVYALIGPAAAHAGSAMWLAFLLAGVTAGLTAYSYARFARLRPKASPEFQYTALAFGPLTGFVAGWLMLLADVLAAATVSLGFGGYLAHLAGTPIAANALALLGAMALLVAAGINTSVGLAVALTIVEAAGLLSSLPLGYRRRRRLRCSTRHMVSAASGPRRRSSSSPISASTSWAISPRRCASRSAIDRARCGSP